MGFRTTLTSLLSMDIRLGLLLGFVFRLGLLGYGRWQDLNFTVKYTDIDYHVFQDAARYIWHQESPYLRSTYRYTPLLAYLFLPEIYLDVPYLGKLLFICMDLLVAVYLLALRAPRPWVYLAWLFNPFVATISTRGNAESLLCFLCVAGVYHTLRGTSPPVFFSSSSSSRTLCNGWVWFRGWPAFLHFVFGAVLFGLSVHMKIYPILYVIPYTVYFLKVCRSFTLYVMFAMVSLMTFGTLVFVFYVEYGELFLQQTYFYHVTRLDHRHNFSVYGYTLALLPTGTGPAWVPFIAQMLGVFVLGVALPFPEDLLSTFFAQTLYFVAFNKVMTSQYFMWALCYLPAVLPHLLRASPRPLCLAFFSWIGSQILWLHFAYGLEFQARNTFLLLFFSSLSLFFSHVSLLYLFIQQQQQQRHRQRPPLH